MMHRTLTALVVIVAAFASLAAAADSVPAEGVVNLNTATADQLQLLPRVGPALASRIISFRDANGAFQSAGELVAVKGIGEKSLLSLKPYIVVKGETTLQTKVKLPRRAKGATETS
jgi:competence protein ComEA